MTRTTRRFSLFAFPFALLTLALTASAQQTYLTSTIDQAQETPPSGSAGTGQGVLVLDATAHTLTYFITFSGLSSAEVAAHIHQGAVGVPGGVIIPLPLGSPKSATVAVTPAQEAALLADNTYINIHSTLFGGGEIRGQINVTPVAPTTLFCPGDGSGTACPCANSSTPGGDEGCLSSLGIGGRLRTSGIPSIEIDTLKLLGDQMPNSNCLYIQGSMRDASGGAGTPTFDGLFCIGGTLLRLGANANVGGASSYPSGAQTSISIRGQNQPGVTRTYQIFYRNAANFCTPATANYSNGAELTWIL